jgi:short-subunit dehydrogenase
VWTETNRFVIKGKSVLITGASGGLGEALARECASRGARLALTGRNYRSLNAIAKTLRARAYRLDVNKTASVSKMVPKVLRDFEGIDVLINNAGMHMFATVAKMPEAALQETLNVNLFGPLRMIQAVVPVMRLQGRGMIVQIGSTVAYRSLENIGAYSATKAALMRLTESLRMELHGTGIQVLDVSPGVLTTKLREHAWYRGPKPAPSDSLPFARESEETAKEIVDAIEAGRRDIMSAAWPVRIAMKYLSVLAPGFLDKRLIGKN